MNVPTITMPIREAREAFLEYRKSVRERHDEEDSAIMRGYKWLMKGHCILNLDDVFRQCPMFPGDIQPRLAVAKYEARAVFARLFSDYVVFYWREGRYGGTPRSTKHRVRLPLPYLRDRRTRNNYEDLRGVVPIVPPRYRPARGFGNLYILWEVDSWETVPGDPMLLKHLGGTMYGVLATWDLTPVERAVLADTRR